MTTGQNSPNCQEEDFNNPVADNYFSHESIYSLCQEEAIYITDRDNKGHFVKGHKFRLGHKHSEETKQKMSQSHKGKKKSEEQKNKLIKRLIGHKTSPETRLKISNSLKGHPVSIEARLKIGQSHKGKHPKNEIKKGQFCGEKHFGWKGGKKLRQARQNGKKRDRGFKLITNQNPYDEPIEYHHIHSKYPFVVPCPLRIHEMFRGDPQHHKNTNAMLNLKIDCAWLKDYGRR